MEMWKSNVSPQARSRADRQPHTYFTAFLYPGNHICSELPENASSFSKFRELPGYFKLSRFVRNEIKLYDLVCPVSASVWLTHCL